MNETWFKTLICRHAAAVLTCMYLSGEFRGTGTQQKLTLPPPHPSPPPGLFFSSHPPTSFLEPMCCCCRGRRCFLFFLTSACMWVWVWVCVCKRDNISSTVWDHSDDNDDGLTPSFWRARQLERTSRTWKANKFSILCHLVSFTGSLCGGWGGLWWWNPSQMFRARGGSLHRPVSEC